MPHTHTTDETLLPPQDLEAERCVLGSILLQNEAFDTIATVVTPETFYHDANRRGLAGDRRRHDSRRTAKAQGSGRHRRG